MMCMTYSIVCVSQQSKQQTNKRGSTFELDLKSKELSPQNCKIKECEETGAAKVEREGLNPVVPGRSPSSMPRVNKECINHKPV